MKNFVFIAAILFAGSAFAGGREVCDKNPNHPLCVENGGDSSSEANAIGVGVGVGHGGDASVDLTNTNTNTNVAGAISGSHSQSNNSVTINDNSRSAASTAGAPSIGGGDDCGVGFSLGSSTFGQSAAAGFSIPGKKCVVRKEAEMLYNMGFKEQAIQHLINNDPRIRRTFQNKTKAETSVSYTICEYRTNSAGQKYPYIQYRRGSDPETAKNECLAVLR